MKYTQLYNFHFKKKALQFPSYGSRKTYEYKLMKGLDVVFCFKMCRSKTSDKVEKLILNKLNKGTNSIELKYYPRLKELYVFYNNRFEFNVILKTGIPNEYLKYFGKYEIQTI